MTHPFIGRQEELKTLSKLLQKKSSSMVVIQGRRRIGKSRLIEEFAKQQVSKEGGKCQFYHFSGFFPTADTTQASERNAFSKQIRQQTGLPEVKMDDWSDIFIFLNEKLKSGRIIVLFDEISWMGSKDPDFLGKLKNAWDIYFKKNPELILFLCGSASAWIEKNILSSTGFVGRISLRITLEELSLPESNQFWGRAGKSKGAHISAYEKLKILSVTGGIPRYLEEIRPMVSAEENIKDLCFTKGGILVTEFKDIFSDLFSKRTPTYKNIIMTLADGALELKEIAQKLKIEQSGFLSEYLDDLVKSGFITRDYTWDIKSRTISRLSHFRLSDNYLRFYLKYIDKNLPFIDNNDFSFKSLTSLPSWEGIMGHQFENMVLRNRRLIKESLNLNPEEIISDNPFFQRKTARIPGCQIDYLIQTKFGGIYVCEVKFSKNVISSSIIPEVQKKMDNFHYPKGYSCRPVLIHVNGVHEDVIDSGFFSNIINFGDYLED